MNKDPGILAVVKVAGTQAALADMLEIRAASVSQWKRVPAERVLEIEQKTGVPRSVMRPDIYPAHEYPTSRFPGSVEAQSAVVDLQPVKVVANG